MRVLTFINWLGRGGVETALLRCLPHLRARGVEVDVCCQGARRELDADFERCGCRILRIRKCAVPLETAWRLGRELRAGRWDLLHSRMGATSGGAVLAAARCGLPAVVSVHNGPAATLPAWAARPGLAAVRRAWLGWHRRLIDRHARMIVGHSAANLDAFAPGWRSDPARHRVVVNGVEPPGPGPDREECRRLLGLEPGRLAVLHVGSFKPQKNHAGLLAAFARVRESEPGALLLLAGAGPERGERYARRAVRAMGLDGAVRFEGPLAGLRAHYLAADVLLAPSTLEGFGNALAEAQAAGLPAVASDIPAHRESVAPGAQRFLFPLPDYARAAELVLEQARAARAGRNPWVAEAGEHVRAHFTVERMAGELADIYGEVAG